MSNSYENNIPNKKELIIYNQTNKTITDSSNFSTKDSLNSLNHTQKFVVDSLCKEPITDNVHQLLYLLT